jgi:hypothetical protein
LNLIECLFINISSDYDGGTIYLYLENNNIYLINSSFVNGNSIYSGGAIYLY